jgi:hypothetical protein
MFSGSAGGAQDLCAISHRDPSRPKTRLHMCMYACTDPLTHADMYGQPLVAHIHTETQTQTQTSMHVRMHTDRHERIHASFFACAYMRHPDLPAADLPANLPLCWVAPRAAAPRSAAPCTTAPQATVPREAPCAALWAMPCASSTDCGAGNGAIGGGAAYGGATSGVAPEGGGAAGGGTEGGDALATDYTPATVPEFWVLECSTCSGWMFRI